MIIFSNGKTSDFYVLLVSDVYKQVHNNQVLLFHNLMETWIQLYMYPMLSIKDKCSHDVEGKFFMYFTLFGWAYSASIIPACRSQGARKYQNAFTAESLAT